jgi:hypothetical protein
VTAVLKGKEWQAALFMTKSQYHMARPIRRTFLVSHPTLRKAKISYMS